MPSYIRVNDTVRVRVVFRDWGEGDDYGDPVDPPYGVVVNLYDEDRNAIAEGEEVGSGDGEGEFYYDWTPTESGVFYIEFIGYFSDPNVDPVTTTIVEEEFHVETAQTSPASSLLEDQEIVFTTDVSPLYVDPEEFNTHFPESGRVEVMEFIHRYSVEVQKLLKTKNESDLPFIAYEYIRAAVLCSLSRIYDYGAGGDESSITLGDLAVTSRTHPRLSINRANAFNWCELAAALRWELSRYGTGMKAVVKGAKFDNPMPERGIDSPYDKTRRGIR